LPLVTVRVGAGPRASPVLPSCRRKVPHVPLVSANRVALDNRRSRHRRRKPPSVPSFSVSATEAVVYHRACGEGDGLAAGRGDVPLVTVKVEVAVEPAPFVTVNGLRARGARSPSSRCTSPGRGSWRRSPPPVMPETLGKVELLDPGACVGGGAVDRERRGVRALRVVVQGRPGDRTNSAEDSDSVQRRRARRGSVDPSRRRWAAREVALWLPTLSLILMRYR